MMQHKTLKTHARTLRQRLSIALADHLGGCRVFGLLHLTDAATASQRMAAAAAAARACRPRTWPWNGVSVEELLISTGELLANVGIGSHHCGVVAFRGRRRISKFEVEVLPAPRSGMP
jgi:hypothetical protein